MIWIDATTYRFNQFRALPTYHQQTWSVTKRMTWLAIAIYYACLKFYLKSNNGKDDWNLNSLFLLWFHERELWSIYSVCKFDLSSTVGIILNCYWELKSLAWALNFISTEIALNLLKQYIRNERPKGEGVVKHSAHWFRMKSKEKRTLSDATVENEIALKMFN